MNSIFISILFISSTLVSAIPVIVNPRDVPSPMNPPALPGPAVDAKYIGYSTNLATNRDSCVATRIGNRALWICRDSQAWDTQSNKAGLPLQPNTASWSDMSLAGASVNNQPGVGSGSDGAHPIHELYGDTSQPYLPLQAPCGSNGICDDGTRYVNWIDHPPLVTADDGTSGTAYAWTRVSHLRDLDALDTPDPATLYKLTWDGTQGRNDYPVVTVANPRMWANGEMTYGSYGSVKDEDGFAYLYVNGDKTGVYVAKVPVNQIEDKNAYQYYNQGAWSKQQPVRNDPKSVLKGLKNLGQGTFYWSEYDEKFVWIGAKQGDFGADFFRSTSVRPEGPWSTPAKIFSGISGDGVPVGSYSLQAVPALMPATTLPGIYLTWTNTHKLESYGGYLNPLVWLDLAGKKP